MSKRISALLALAAMLLIASVASAQTITLDLVYSGTSYDSGFSSSYDANTLALTGAGTGHMKFAPGVILNDDVHIVQIYMELAGQASDESFKYLQSRASLSGTSNTWAPLAGASVDFSPASGISYDPPPGGPVNGSSRGLFQVGDDGIPDDLVDLRWLTDALNENKAAHGLNPGESGPFYLGDLYLNINGMMVGTNIIGLGPSAVSTPFQLWQGGTSQTTGGVAHDLGPGAVLTDEVVNWEIVPEPAALVLMALAAPALALAIRRRKAA
jgi:hypothetical protein